MTKAFNGSKEVPIELIEYRLCEHFGWTPAQLDRQDHAIIERFIGIMNIESQLKKATMEAANHGQH